MAKYHINNNGEVGVCSAVYNCQFGYPLDSHYSTAESATKAYETKMLNSALSTFSKPPISEVPLGEVLDVDLLKQMLKGKYVLESVHPEDDALAVYAYDKRVQVEGKWNSVTKTARGLIVNRSDSSFNDAVVVQRPWEKFFTLQQIESGWALGDDGEGESTQKFDLSKIDFNSPAEVTDKMDGSMLVLYMDPSGKPAYSTKGSFQSEQAIRFTDLMRRNQKMFEASERLLKNHSDTTFLFEGVGKGKSQIVLRYDKDDVSMLGAVRKRNGLYLSNSQYLNIWRNEDGLSSAEKMPAKTIAEALELPDRENREGVVIRLISENPKEQFQIKVKQADYLALHKSRTTFSYSALREKLRNQKATVGDLLNIAKTKDVTMLEAVKKDVDMEGIDPESYGAWIKEENLKEYNNSILPYVSKLAKAYEKVSEIPDEHFTGEDSSKKRKEFALSVRGIGDRREAAFLLSFYNDRWKGVNSLEKNASKNLGDISSEISPK